MLQSTPWLLSFTAMCVALQLAITPAAAWGCTGHMLVAEIAQRHLSDGNRAKAAAMAAAFSESGPFPRSPDLVQVACWADDLKSWHQYAMKPWHYVDIPYNPDNLSVVLSPYVAVAGARVASDVALAGGSPCRKRIGGGSDTDECSRGARHGLHVLDSERANERRRSAGRADAEMKNKEEYMLDTLTYAVPAPTFTYEAFAAAAEDDENGGNVVTSIRNMVVAMKAQKAPPYSLYFAMANLVHFVGDVHQPLHATTRYSKRYPHGDRGGNSVIVVVGGKETSLHALWDNMCLGAVPHSVKRPMHEEDYADLRRYADVLEDSYKFSKADIAESTASAMAWESHMFAVNTTYPGVVEGEELSESYLVRCRAAAEARVTLAGLRLGRILDALLDDID